MTLYNKEMMKTFLLALVFSCLLIHISAQQTILFVIPDMKAENTVPLCETEKCISFESILNKRDLFTSDTTLAVFPGNHIIKESGEFVINNVTNFKVIGYYEPQANNINDTVATTILCRQHFGMLFSDVFDLTVSNITFKNCGIYSTFIDFASLFPDVKTPLGYTVLVVDSSTVIFDRVIVNNGTGVGLRLLDVTGDTVIKSSHLTANGINCIIEITDRYYFEPVTAEPAASVKILDTKFTHGRANSKFSFLNEKDSTAGLIIRSFQDNYTTEMNLTNVIFYENNGSRGNFYIGLRGCGSNISI